MSPGVGCCRAGQDKVSSSSAFGREAKFSVEAVHENGENQVRRMSDKATRPRPLKNVSARLIKK